MIRRVETPAPTRRTALLLFAAAAVIVAVDQVTKALVVSDLREGESRRVIGGVLAWTLQRNPGSAFGLFRHFPVVFTILAARPPGVFRGRVIDFIDFHWWPVFNVADAAVVIGALLLLMASYRAERRAKERERAAT